MQLSTHPHYSAVRHAMSYKYARFTFRQAIAPVALQGL